MSQAALPGLGKRLALLFLLVRVQNDLVDFVFPAPREGEKYVTNTPESWKHQKKGGLWNFCQLAAGEWISTWGFINHSPLYDFQEGA